jgi:flagellar biosynthesis GTPase FlhF
MQPPDRAGTTGTGEPSTADLVRGIAEDASTLVKQEVLLAKQEVTEGLTRAAKAGAMLAVAGVVGLYALGFLLTTLAWTLEAIGLPKWASFGIVALVLLIVAGILGLIGQRRMAASKIAPERAQAEARQATADLAAEAKAAAEGVKADLAGSARAARAEATAVPERAKAAAESVPDKAKAAAETVASQVQDATERARQKMKRDGSDAEPRQ